ncbi:MAG: MFS transporter [Phenylobacterium sp.]|nr:MFS transporter [Phenylobacterium sp.]
MSANLPAGEAHGPGAVADSPIAAELAGDGRMNRGAVAWSLFEGARNPYVVLVTIYIFAPYIASVMIGDPVKGQAVISQWSQYSGWIIMATAPFLGASIDQLGGRKLWLGLVVAAMVPMMAALWWAKPDGSGLSVTVTMLLITLIGLGFAFSEVLHNSLLIRAAGMRAAHKASGLALALGNGISVLALAFTAWAFALPGRVDWAWVPKAPLFGLDTAAHEHERIVALMAAGIFAIGALPLFLFTPDAPRTEIPVLRAFRNGARQLWEMLATVRNYRDAAIYLVSRMAFVDGMNAILIYAGVYAVGVMKWQALEMLAYGILLSVLAVLGGFTGRWMDAALGPKNALRVAIFMSILGIVAMLGMSPTRILFFWTFDPSAYPPVWEGPVFRTLPEVIFLLIGFVNAVFITAQYASARTMLTRLTPPDKTGAFFGVYALSGVATGWLGPMMVNFGTNLTRTQQGGFATVIILLVAGLIGLGFVRGGGKTLEV